MFLYHFILFATIVMIESQEVEILSNILDSANTPIKVIEADVLLMGKKFTVKADKPTLKLYYESLCPDCIEFDSTQFKKVVDLLHQYVNIHTYPYGNARTTNHTDGTVEVICQHGALECYGNKLHGCALDIIANATEALLFNACMIQQHSDDNSADMSSSSRLKDSDLAKRLLSNDNSWGRRFNVPSKGWECSIVMPLNDHHPIPDRTERCLIVSDRIRSVCVKLRHERFDITIVTTCGEQMNIKVDSIKECAKGKKGNDILIHYGEESKKVGFQYVPYVLLNGVEWQEKDLFSDLCAAFKDPPEPCRQKS